MRFDEPEEIIHRDATGFHDIFRRFVVMCRRVRLAERFSRARDDRRVVAKTRRAPVASNFVTISSIFLVYCFSVAYTGSSALGRLDLAIRYSGKAKGKQGRRMKLTVNGKVIDDDLLFPNTNDWGSNWKTISVNIPFDRGANTIRLTTIENGGMYIDEMSIVPSP